MPLTIGIGLSLTEVNGPLGAAAAFSPAALLSGNAGIWIDPSDLSTLF